MWGICTGIQSLGVFTCQPARNYGQGAEVILPSLCFPARLGIQSSSNPDKKQENDPRAIGPLCQAAKSSKTAAQSETVNTSEEGPGSQHAWQENYSRDSPKLRGNNYLPMDVYILTETGGEKTVERQMMCQQIATKSLKKQLALAGLHHRAVVMKTKHPKGGVKR